MIALLIALSCTGTTPDSETDDTDTQDTQPLACEYTGCDELCVEVGSEWFCTDTAAPFEACYDEGYQLCEAQSSGSCGWTMLDQAGWDTCIDEN